MASQADFFKHADVLFGRQKDVDYLLGRVETPGITFVLAGPQMGKSWLLLDVAQRLTDRPKSPEPLFLVGYHECRQGEDQFQYALQDLYTRWLENATFLQEAKMAWSGHKDNWVSLAAGAVSSIFGGVSKLTGGVTDAVGGIVQDALAKLVSENDKLKTGGQDLPRLPIDKGRDLLEVVKDISGRRIVLIFDAWEKAASVDNERDSLEFFLKHKDDWPAVHLLVAFRKPDAANAPTDAASVAARFVKDSNGTVGWHELGAMDSSDPAEEARLLAHVRQCLPKASSVPDEQILGILDGYPATLQRWTESPALATADDLQASADDARFFLYNEFRQSLPALSKEQRILAMRLCLLPRMAPATWALLRGFVEDGLEKDGWLDCCESGLLINEPYPTFGHDTRHQAVATWFKTGGDGAYHPRLRAEANRLIARMTVVLDLNKPNTVTVLQALRVVARTLGVQDLDTFPKLIANMSAAAWREDVGASLLDADPWPDAPETRKTVSGILAGALYNSVLDAVLTARDPKLATSLLGLLRQLHQDYPEDRSILRCFAMVTVDVAGICRNTGNEDGAKALLIELRGLAETIPSAPALWHEYATALYNKILAVLRKGAFADVAPILAELRSLPPQPPDAEAQHFLSDTLRMTIVEAAFIP
jgi:hypothetical protein